MDKKRQQSSFSLLVYCTKCFPISSSKSNNQSEEKQIVFSDPNTTKRKPAGWKAMPFVLGNETFERLASFGLLANFMIFLLTQFHMEQANAANLINIWSGVANFAPLLGGFISDAYLGRFRTIAFASFASLLGLILVTLITWIPQLHPPSCNPHQAPHDQCKGPTTSQLGILIMALGFLSIGTGGIRPCSIPFGVDQFDSKTDEGRKGINSFFNWYYTSFTMVLIVSFTLVIYIQDSISWVLGFGIPTFFMFCSIVLFFFGTKIYVYVMPEGSVFSGIAHTLVATYKKRRLKLSVDGEAGQVFYDPPPMKGTVVKKLPLTNQFRFLNKAAIIMDGELNPDGSPLNPKRLRSIQQIEELKCLMKIVPIWLSGFICFTSIAQQGTFTVSQALKMDRHIGPKFQIPPGSLTVISMMTIAVWLPLYDRVIVPFLQKRTKLEGGITLLQRIGIGIVLSILSMVVAGLTEQMRRKSAILHGGPDGVAPLSVMWLAPQLILMGFAEAFNIIGQIEFYNKESPENMSSVANSLFSCTIGGANYISSFLITIVHGVTGTHGRPDWLTNDINAGKIDYFYFLIAGLGFMNLIYFLFFACRYRYKISAQIMEDKDQIDIELNAPKQ